MTSAGQLLTGSFMDYAMPRASDVPYFVLANHPVPAKTNPLGVKGCGEAGCAGALTSMMNAVIDALADHGIRHVDMPLTPYRIWQALRDAERSRPARNDASSFRSARSGPAESRLIAARLRRAHDEPLLHAHAGAAVRVHPRRLQRQLYRAGAGADRIQRRLRVAADAGRLSGRPHRRAHGADRRPRLEQHRLCDRGHGAIPIGSSSRCTASPASAIPSITRRIIRCCRAHAPPDRLSQIFSYHTFAGMVGSAIAPVTLLYMQSLFGWRGAYIGAAIFGLVVLLVVIAQPEPAVEPGHPARTASDEVPPTPAGGS